MKHKLKMHGKLKICHLAYVLYLTAIQIESADPGQRWGPRGLSSSSRTTPGHFLVALTLDQRGLGLPFHILINPIPYFTFPGLYSTLLFLIQPYPTLPYLIPSQPYPTLPFPIDSYPTLPCPTPSHYQNNGCRNSDCRNNGCRNSDCRINGCRNSDCRNNDGIP